MLICNDAKSVECLIYQANVIMDGFLMLAFTLMLVAVVAVVGIVFWCIIDTIGNALVRRKARRTPDGTR